MLPLLEYLLAAERQGASRPPDQRRIAIDVFGRDELFDPTCDAIVRVEIGRLRNKLREYYATEGVDDHVLIDVPLGRYSVQIMVRHSVAQLYREPLPKQSVRYCQTPDGVRIAYSTLGEGYPLICLSHWLSHLEADAANPFVRHYWVELSRRFQLIRYDIRGFGMSQRELPKLEFDDLVADLETVVDALGLERFALLGPSGGAPVGTAYAARHPERVSHLMLLGGFIRGPRRTGDPKTSQAHGRGAAGRQLRRKRGALLRRSQRLRSERGSARDSRDDARLSRHRGDRDPVRGSRVLRSMHTQRTRRAATDEKPRVDAGRARLADVPRTARALRAHRNRGATTTALAIARIRAELL